MFDFFSLVSAKCACAVHELRDRMNRQEGAATAEYAIVVMAAIALAGVLMMVIKSGGVKGVIENLIVNAFKAPK